MKLGIVGLPNVGKSTLFNAITKAGAEAANYPFCTIEPNVGVVTVPDQRVTKLHEIYNSKRTIYATIEFCGKRTFNMKYEELWGNSFFHSILTNNTKYFSFLREHFSCRLFSYLSILTSFNLFQIA